MSFQKKYWSFRRKLLKTFVPEFVWPQQAEIDGVIFKIRGTPYSYGTKQALKTGNYEVCERKLLQNQISPGDVIIEMGGSIGVLTAILAKMAGDKGSVISIEASQNIAAYSKKWLEQKGNIQVLSGFGFPVFSIKKKIAIHGFNEQEGSLGGKLFFDIVEEDSTENDERVFDIEKIIQQFNIVPTVLVIDIEGSEKIITTIQPSFPASVRLILMETHTHLYGITTRNKIVNRIEEEGFKIINEEQGVYLFKRT